MILSVSVFSVAVVTKTDPLPKKTILILNMNGHIDSTLVSSFEKYFEEHPQPPDFLILHMNSEGGYYIDTLILASGLRSMENLGTRVYFLANGTCSSGCYLLASFANQVYAMPRTKMGFNHTHDEMRDIYPQVQAMLYSNNRLIIIESLGTESPPMNLAPEVCVKKGNEFVIIYPFLDGCANSLETLLSSIQSKHGFAYEVKTATLEANQELGTP